MSELVVAVYREGKGFRVEPGRLLVRHADTITMCSVDGLPVTAFVPPSLGGEARIILLGGEHPRFGPLPLKPGIAPGCYEYAVHVDDDRVFAEGGSQPKIIVLE